MIAHMPPTPSAMIEQRREEPQDVVLARMFDQIADSLNDPNPIELRDFLRESWPVVEPAKDYLTHWHIDAITEHLEAVACGQITRLIINGPPRCGKSFPVSIQFPAYLWSKDPSKQILQISHDDKLAYSFNVRRRNVILSPWYQERWGMRFSLADDENLKGRFSNSMNGHMMAAGTKAGVTGHGADLVILDDSINPKMAESKAERETAHSLYDGSIYTRLNSKRYSAVIINEQRTHIQDMTGHLEKNGENWVKLELPSIQQKGRVYVYPMTGTRVEREKDSVLWAEKEDAEILATIKRAMGSRKYSAQYLQAPQKTEGNIFKRAWIKYYMTLPDDLEDYQQSWDMAFKGTEDSDYVAGGVWASVGADDYLLDLVHAQLDFVETLDAVDMLSKRWPKTITKLVEDKANGAAVVSMLKRKIPGLIPVNPKGGKVVRAHAVEGLVEAGNVLFPHPKIAPWVVDLVDEVCAFTGADGGKDDRVDMMTQYLVRKRAPDGMEWRPA